MKEMVEKFRIAKKLARDLWEDEEGQGIVEYVLILGLIVIAAIFVMQRLGQNVTNTMSQINDTLGGVAPLR